MYRGKFITLEGGEGAGKSTQAKLLHAKLVLEGIDAILTREPGGTPMAEQIREILLSGSMKDFGSDFETMLFARARKDHVDNLIRPALREGKWVICDRFIDSTWVYQGYVSDANIDLISYLEYYALDENRIKPDMTFLLEISAEIGLSRAHNDKILKDRFESENIDFHNTIVEGYHVRSLTDENRFVNINANRDKELVFRDIWKTVENKFL